MNYIIKTPDQILKEQLEKSLIKECIQIVTYITLYLEEPFRDYDKYNGIRLQIQEEGIRFTHKVGEGIKQLIRFKE